MPESRSRSAGHHRSRSRRSFRVPYAPLAGLAVLVVLGLVFGLAFLRQPGTTGEAALNLTSKPVPSAAGSVSAAPTAAPKKHRPKATSKKRKKPATTTAAAKPAPGKTTHRPRPKKTTTAPATGTGGGGSSSPISSFVSQVLTLTNQERAKAGCKALTTSAALTTAAQAHSVDMAAKNYFSHDSQDGRSPFDRMKTAGYDFSAAAENIATGQQTPASVMHAWMNSAGHKANILNCTYTQIGIGYATGNGSPYWTQDFGKPL
jgi:uncharacterized protein YkwD